MSETPRTNSLLFDEVVLLRDQVRQRERDLSDARAENERLREARPFVAAWHDGPNSPDEDMASSDKPFAALTRKIDAILARLDAEKS